MSDIVEKKIGDQSVRPFISLRQLGNRIGFCTESTCIILVNAMMLDGVDPESVLENGHEFALAWAEVNFDKLQKEAETFRGMPRNAYMDARFASAQGKVNAIPVIGK